MHRVLCAVSVLGFAAAASAQQYNNNFDFGDPQGAQVFGDATFTAGALRLTQAIPGMSGAIVLPISAQNVQSFTASFNLRYENEGGLSADGVSFNLGVLPNGVIPGASENGPGNGLTVMVDNFDFDNDGFVFDEGLRVFMNGTEIASVELFLPSSLSSTPIDIALGSDGTLDVRFEGNLVVNNLATGFVPQNGQRFGLASRTGGEAAAHFIDDLIVSPRYRQGLCTDPQAIRGDGLFSYFVGPDTTSNQSGASCASTTQPIWFCWQAPLTGVARVSTVGLATHDTVLSAFEGCAPCPAAFGEIACNDDSSGLQSQITFPTNAGATYLIRVAEFGGSTSNLGPHAFSISSTEDCRADFNGDGSIDPDDLGDFINTYFGGCP
ncbi:MAG: hypothetical protein AB7K52_03480 [Phycisphaerales bacterium]